MKRIIALALVVISIFAVAIPAMAAVTTGYYNTAAVHLRSTIGGVSLGLAHEGTTCDILDTSTDSSGRQWYKVKITSHTSNGGVDLYNKTGWSWKQYITVSGGSAPSSHPQNMDEAFGPAGVYLQVGSSGKYVRNLQMALNHINHSNFDIDVDGDFGQATLGAVERFQQIWMGEDEPDGIVGNETKTRLWYLAGDHLMQNGIK